MLTAGLRYVFISMNKQQLCSLLDSESPFGLLDLTTQPSDADSSAAITWREKSGQAAGSIYLMLEPDIQVMVAQHLMDAAVM